MTGYKLVYFKARGKGEVTRLLFHAAGIPFEDEQLNRSDWIGGKHNDRKEESPTGQVPYLIIDNKEKLGQSLAVTRFVAKQVGLAGKTEVENAKCDTVVESIEDLASAYLKSIFFVKDPETKAQNIKKFKETDAPLHLGRIERLIKLYGSNGYCVGNTLSWADLYLYEKTDYLLRFDENILKDSPLVLASRKLVESHPKLAKYLASRPPASSNDF